MDTPQSTHITYIIRERIDGPVRALHLENDAFSSLDTSPELSEAVKNALADSHTDTPHGAVTLLGKLIGKGHGGGGFAMLDSIHFIVTHALFSGMLTDEPDAIRQLAPESPFTILPIEQTEVWSADDAESTEYGRLRFLTLCAEVGETIKDASPLLERLLGVKLPGNGATVDVADGDYGEDSYQSFYSILPLRTAS